MYGKKKAADELLLFSAAISKGIFERNSLVDCSIYPLYAASYILQLKVSLIKSRDLLKTNGYKFFSSVATLPNTLRRETERQLIELTRSEFP